MNILQCTYVQGQHGYTDYTCVARCLLVLLRKYLVAKCNYLATKYFLSRTNRYVATRV